MTFYKEPKDLVEPTKIQIIELVTYEYYEQFLLG